MNLVRFKGFKPAHLFAKAGRGVTLLALLALVTLAISPALAADPAGSPQAPSAPWDLHQVDAAHYFLNLTDRSLRFDKNGYPHVAYGGKYLYYAWYDGSKWNQTTVDSSPGVGEYAALALDASNRPFISYYDTTNRSLKFAWYTGAYWDIYTVDSPTTLMMDMLPENLHRLNVSDEVYLATAYPMEAVGLFTSITVDSLNVVHISYVDTQVSSSGNPNNPPGVLKYARWDGVTWQKGITIDNRNNVGIYSSIAINPDNGRPCVSYMSELYDDLKYACPKADGSWNPVTVDEVGDTGAFTSLAFDSAGNAHISYQNFGSSSLKYATNKSGNWVVNSMSSSGSVGWYTSIAVGSNNDVYISYLDNTNPRVMWMRSSDGWTAKVAANVSPKGLYTSVALDKNNRQGIVYFRTEDARLIYTHYNGSKWIETSLDISGNVGIASTLDLTASGSPYIGYYNEPPQDLKYAYAFGNSWRTTNLLASGYQAGYYQSLKIDPNTQRPRIAYYDAATGDLKLAVWNGTVWELWPVDINTNDVGWYVSLALDSAGNPHFSYYDASNGDLKYATWTGSQFQSWVVDSTGDVGKYSSIALDSSNRPFISYYDTTNGNLKWAYKSVTNVWIGEAVDTGGDVGQFTSIKVDNFNQKHISYYDVTNGNLKYALYNGGWSTSTVDSTGNVGLYTSIAVDNFGQAHISYYDASFGDLKYAVGYFGGLSTETVAIPGIVGLYTSIDLNASGQPAISYYDYSMGELWAALAYPLPDPPYTLRVPYVGKGN
jgi:hypothetical protein